MKYEVTYKINKTYLCSIEVEASSPNEAILEAQSLSGEELESGILRLSKQFDQSAAKQGSQAQLAAVQAASTPPPLQIS